MIVEIERKFLVKNNAWKKQVVTSKRCVQGYVATKPGCTVRVRIMGDQGFLTLKGPRKGITRAEYEYPIPVQHAEDMLSCLTGVLVSKTRHFVEHAGHTWEVDVFHDENDGLIVAELELEHEAEAFETPAWLGLEVSKIGRYTNKSLSVKPYTQWDLTLLKAEV
jgi:adenylate cyclase